MRAHGLFISEKTIWFYAFLIGFGKALDKSGPEFLLLENKGRKFDKSYSSSASWRGPVLTGFRYRTYLPRFADPRTRAVLRRDFPTSVFAPNIWCIRICLYRCIWTNYQVGISSKERLNLNPRHAYISETLASGRPTPASCLLTLTWIQTSLHNYKVSSAKTNPHWTRENLN